MISHYLILRGITNQVYIDSNSNHTCPSKEIREPDIVHFVNNLTYHQFSIILAGSCGLLSALLVGMLIVTHSVNYSNPVQQRQIIRIVLLVPWVALFSFLAVWREDAGGYFVESLGFGCSIALSSFLLFMCGQVLSRRGGFDDLLGRHAWSKGAYKGDSPKVLRQMWYGVLQFIINSILIWVATVITLATGVFCKQSNSVHFAHIWIAIAKTMVTSIAVIYCCKFYPKNKAKLVKHRILLKLFTLTGFIELNVLQGFIISILTGRHIIKPTKYMTYHDINTGLPALILACEMPIFSVLLLFVFPATPYTKKVPAAGPLSAIVDAFNITDILSTFIHGPLQLVRDQHKQIRRQDRLKKANVTSPLTSVGEKTEQKGKGKEPLGSTAT